MLVTGVPGSGKTLVGLCAVHSPALDDLAVDGAGGKPSRPAIFLSGNGPLVQVLQYELASAGGGGKTFVRDVKNYVKEYLGDNARGAAAHVIVYDEAQRAWDLEQVSPSSRTAIGTREPELFVEFGERVPEWCVFIGLIGSGQESTRAKRRGSGSGATHLPRPPPPDGWTVHAPQRVLDEFFTVADATGRPLPVLARA